METHFVCDVEACVLSSDFVFYSSYGDDLVNGVSLLVKPSLYERVDLVHTDAGAGMVDRGQYCREQLFVSDRCVLCS